MIENMLHDFAKAWPEVLGGGITYAVHTALHGFYRRIGRTVMRLVRLGGRGGR